MTNTILRHIATGLLASALALAPVTGYAQNDHGPAYWAETEKYAAQYHTSLAPAPAPAQVAPATDNGAPAYVKGLSEKYDIQLVQCLKNLPLPESGPSQEVDKVIDKYVDLCAQDYAAYLSSPTNPDAGKALLALAVAEVLDCETAWETHPQGDYTICLGFNRPRWYKGP